MKISKLSLCCGGLIFLVLGATFIDLFPPFIKGDVAGHPTIAIRLDIPWLGLLVIATVVALAMLGMHLNAIAFSKYKKNLE